MFEPPDPPNVSIFLGSAETPAKGLFDVGGNVIFSGYKRQWGPWPPPLFSSGSAHRRGSENERGGGVDDDGEGGGRPFVLAAPLTMRAAGSLIIPLSPLHHCSLGVSRPPSPPPP
jgi:hypothetical protein